MEQKMRVAKMGTLRSTNHICIIYGTNGVIRKDRIRNECIRRSFGAFSIKGETKKNKKRWFEHDVMRRDEIFGVGIDYRSDRVKRRFKTRIIPNRWGRRDDRKQDNYILFYSSTTYELYKLYR